MKVKFLYIILIKFLSSGCLLSQELNIFELPLYTKKFTLCEALDNFKLDDEFEFIQIGENLFSLIEFTDDKIFKTKAFVLLKDTINQSLYELSQIEISSGEFSITKLNFNNLKLKALELDQKLKETYGKPTKMTINSDRFWGEENDQITGYIIMAVWVNNGIKLKIEFSKAGEHDQFIYGLHISKFKDYFGNVKLPKWWDGY